MNILAVGAHGDDVEIGCGGTLAKCSKRGDNIVIYTATASGGVNPYGEQIRDAYESVENGKMAAKILNAELIVGRFETAKVEYNDDIDSELIKIIKDYEIDMMLTHWPGDPHHDHSNVSKASIHAGRHLNKVLTYQSNWYQPWEAFYPNFFVDISETQSIKEELMNCYKAEMERTNGAWIEYQRNLSRNYGFKTGTKYAEGFQCVKWIL